ncbi:MAG: hypothetical protein ACOZF0_21200 [Thermodesulfobacteriota bacterium]
MDVYLCQVRSNISCGACCGLYNVPDPSRNALEKMLIRRTEIFAGVPRTVTGIDDFRMKIEGWTAPDRPFPRFHHCPFLGMIGGASGCVGCLLHPAAPGNNGVDWRGLSYYGGMACRTYFCPTYRHLPAVQLEILRASMDHWHPFGLIVTERKLLAAFFQELENRLQRPVRQEDFPPASQAAGLFQEFAALKMNWPHRRADAPGPCNYFFENGEYDRPPVQRTGEAIPVSRYEDILRELDSAIASPDELFAAEQRLERLFSMLRASLMK